jgi:hypothetical protein
VIIITIFDVGVGMFALLSFLSRIGNVQPSTWAGAALVMDGMAGAVASKGADTTAWAKIAGGVAAMLKDEGAAK